MRAFFSIFIFSLLSIGPFSQVITILDYHINLETIIDEFCVNKEKPKLKCNGKCYLMSKIGSSVTTTKENHDKPLVFVRNLFAPLYFKNKKIELKKPDFYWVPISQNWNMTPIIYSLIIDTLDPPPPKGEC